MTRWTATLPAMASLRRGARVPPGPAPATEFHRTVSPLPPRTLPARPWPSRDGLFFSAQPEICAIVARRAGAAATKTMPSPPTLLSVLPENLAAKLFANSRAVKLAADEVLFVAGDPGDGCYRVEQGLLKISMIAPSGAERILAIVGPGGIIGELSTIDGLPRSASVAAVRESELTFVSRAAFQAFAEDHPQVYKNLVALLAARLRDTDGVVAAGSFLPLKGRVARALLDLAEAFGQDVGQGRILIRQKVSQSDLAAMAGIARENVSRILNDWIRDKLVSRLSGYYCLENKKKLERESAI